MFLVDFATGSPPKKELKKGHECPDAEEAGTTKGHSFLSVDVSEKPPTQKGARRKLKPGFFLKGWKPGQKRVAVPRSRFAAARGAHTTKSRPGWGLKVIDMYMYVGVYVWKI